MALAVALGMGLNLGMIWPVAAQQNVRACTSQQELEQAMESGGSISPEGCRTMAVGVLASDGARLCRLELRDEDGNILDELRAAALPSSWWVECGELAAALSQ